MNIFVIGSGGREHAICAAFSRSRRVRRIYCAEGNAGIASVAECVPIKVGEVGRLAEFAASNSIDLTFVGGETTLALGIVDEFERRGLRIVGPSAAAARLEASKIFAKEFMQRHAIPTARFAACDSPETAAEVLRSGTFGDADLPLVVKADGLAAGKGVVVARDRAEALAAISNLAEIAGKQAASSIVLEECLVGREVSLLFFTDGKSFALMPATRDHKRVFDGDRGPNTGGMGTITDESLLTSEQTAAIVEKMIVPTLRGCREEGFPFRGVLFLGLMLAEGRGPAGAIEPMLLEYNVRFGDPETQAILIRLDSDLVDICEAMLSGTLHETEPVWRPGNSACVIAAASGYPEKPRKGDTITGLDEAAGSDVAIYHSGTALGPNGEFLTAGGRVIGVTAMAENLDDAIASAYESLSKVKWDGMHFRRDIGRK